MELATGHVSKRLVLDTVLGGVTVLLDTVEDASGALVAVKMEGLGLQLGGIVLYINVGPDGGRDDEELFLFFLGEFGNFRLGILGIVAGVV